MALSAIHAINLFILLLLSFYHFPEHVHTLCVCYLLAYMHADLSHVHALGVDIVLLIPKLAALVDALLNDLFSFTHLSPPINYTTPVA